MDTLLTPSNITFALGLVGIIFGVYKMFHDPQVSMDKQLNLDKQDVDSQVKLLALQVTNDRQATDRRFSEMMQRLDDALTLAQNHTHTVDVKVDGLTVMVNAMNIEMTKGFTRFGTIFEERFSKK